MKVYECQFCWKEYIDFKRDTVAYRFMDFEGENVWIYLNPEIVMPTHNGICEQHGRDENARNKSTIKSV